MASAVDRLIVAAAPWPLFAMCGSLRFARLYRRRVAIAAIYLLLYACALAALALVAPLLLIPWALVATAASVLLLWRSRPGYGHVRGLPPGRLRPFPVRPVTDPDYVAAHIARHGPISKAAMPQVAQPLVLVHGLARGASVLRANDARLQWVGMSFDSLIPAGFIRSMNAEDHRHYIRILRTAFADHVVDECRPSFSRAARLELARLGAASGSTTGLDPRPWLARYALASLARLFFAFEPGSAGLAAVERLYHEPGPLQTEWGGGRDVLRRAVDDAVETMRRQEAAIRESIALGEEPASSFLTELVRELPDGIDENLALNLVFMLATTFRDVTGLLHWVVKMLGDNPAWCDRLRSADDADDLASRIVLETLRLEQSEYVLRRVLEPIEIEEYVVPAGWYLRVCVRESHRDPAVFPDPATFDPNRFLGARHTRDEYSPLGMTNRPCIGVATTIGIAGAFAEELTRGWDWRIVRDGRAEFDGFHWRPSSRFRIAVAPRAASEESEPARVVGAA